MSITTVSSKGQVVIPRHLREKQGLTPGMRLQVSETNEGLVLSPVKPAGAPTRRRGWRSLRACAKGTKALEQYLADHRREAKR